LMQATVIDVLEINSLLKAEDLPEVDPREFSAYFFKVLNPQEKIIGAIGLEVYGEYGLLRSMVVDKNHRSKGIAKEMVEQIMNISAEIGLYEVYLLTNTADQYFLKNGFEVKQREHCPSEIKNSSEFKSICPLSAILMSKKVS
jgi:amino-acid N-acetyltransferase